MSPFSGDLFMTALVTLAALAAVGLPWFRGLGICLRARIATRRMPREELKSRLAGGRTDDVEPIALLMARIVRKSLREGSREYPTEFVVDAARQYAINEYEAHYARPISMYANLLPPIGFIGTTGGLLILFLSMHLADSTLELGALAIALTSSIFALMAYAMLEGIKIRLYAALMACLDDVLSLQRAADNRRAAGDAAAATSG